MRTMTAVMAKIKQLRQQQGISVGELATYVSKEIGFTISTKTVYGWEEGNSKPDVSCFMAICRFIGIENPSDLFFEKSGTENISENVIGLQRVINLLSTIRDAEYVGESEESMKLSDNMKTEILYQLMDRAESEGKKKDMIALKWAILQIEKTK